jgi:hypothetical protein
MFGTRIQERLGAFGATALGEIVASTLAVEGFLFPYLLYTNGSFSLVSFPANLLVLSFLPFTMLCGFAAALLSYVHIALAYPFAFASFVMLRYILRIVDMAASLSFVAIKL